MVKISHEVSADQGDHPHSQELSDLEEKLGNQYNICSAKKLVKEIARDLTKVTTEGDVNKKRLIVFEALDKAAVAEIAANAAQDIILQAQINATLGKIYYKYLADGEEEKTDEKKKRLECAQNFYTECTKSIKQEMQASNGIEPIEVWYTESRKENTAVKEELIKLDEENLTEEDKESIRVWGAKYNEVEAYFKSDECKGSDKKADPRKFIRWLQEQPHIVPEKAKKILDNEFDNKDFRFARIIGTRIVKHFHPDQHKNKLIGE